MKIVTCIALIIFFTANICNTQQFKTVLEDGRKYSVNLLDIDADIEVSSHDQNEILIIPSSLPSVPEKAEGLRPLITTSGVDNTGISLNMRINGEVITFEGGHNDEHLTYRVYIPESTNLYINSENYTKKINITATELSSDIEVILHEGSINMDLIRGPVKVRINKGDVTISFSRIRQDSPIDLVCHKGDIDISMPASEPVTFRLRAPLGNIFTDLAIDPTANVDTLSYDGLLIGSKNGKDLWTYNFDPRKRVEQVQFDDIESIEVDKDSRKITVTSRETGEVIIKKIYEFDWNNSRDVTNKKILSLQVSAGEYSFIIGQFRYDFTGSINGGGVEMDIRSEEGNIYLRGSR